MYIHELLNNPEFNFNAPVRILKYLGGDETVTVFDSTVSGAENADSLYSTHFPALWQGVSTHPGVFFL